MRSESVVCKLWLTMFVACVARGETPSPRSRHVNSERVFGTKRRVQSLQSWPLLNDLKQPCCSNTTTADETLQPYSKMSRLALSVLLYHTSALSLPTRKSITKATRLRAQATTGGAAGTTGEAPLAVAGACVGASLFGYHLGVVNAPLQAMAATMGFGDVGSGLVVSSTLVGAVGGALLAGPAADRLGRRGALRWNCIPLILAALGCASAGTLRQLIICRALAGVGIGLLSAVAPLYISEVSPVAKRGANGALNQVAICLGIVVSIFAGLGVTPLSSARRWRSMFAGALVPTLAHLVLTFKIPESPRWPGSSTVQEDARRLWGAEAEAELSLAEKPGPTAGWGAMVSARHRRATLTAFLLFVCQQLSGINAVVYFSTQIFRDAGVTSAVLSSLLVMLVNVAGTAFVAAPLIDTFGRTNMLSASYAGMAACMVAMGTCLGMPALAGTPLLTALTVFGTIAYVFVFSCGCGPVPSLLVPELFPAELRGKGGSVAMLSHWGFNAVVGATFLPLITKYSIPSVYLGFGAVAALSGLFTKFGIKETPAPKAD